MVTLAIPPKENVGLTMQFLNNEYAQAANIKSKQTRDSVQTAIVSTREKLKLYKATPQNGLIIFCGIVMMEDGKTEKKMNIDMEPFKPVTQKSYNCAGSFDTKVLEFLLEDDEKFGFIIVDGSGSLFATLQGNVRHILQKITVELPKKHGRGGQSANRFARLREEKRHHYVTKVAELAAQNFLTNDRPNVKGIIMAGSADFKTVISQSDRFDKRLQEVVIASYDVSYGGENGLNQAVTLAGDALANVRFVEEKNLCSKFFTEISLDSQMIIFGMADTMRALDMSAVEKVLLYDNIEHMRYEIKHPQKDETKVLYLTKKQEEDPKYFKCPETGIDLEIISSEPLADWMCVNYGNFGAKIELITDKTEQGFQFVKGFGGIGGFLRYKVDVDVMGPEENGFGGEEFDADEDFI